MKPKTILWWAAGAVVLVVALVAMFSSPRGGGISNVDAQGVRDAMANGAQVVDVRTAGEYQMGHIPGAVNVPVDTIESAASAWDTSKTYVVYCATGSRSVAAVEAMKALGFGNIKHFNAGIQAWDGDLEKGETANQKIETSGKPVLIEFFTNA